MNINESNRELLQRRWVYRTLREVWLVDGQIVEKHFTHHSGRRDWRPLWNREHEALVRLNDLPVPRSLGWHRETTPDGPRYILRKSYVPGRSLTLAGPGDAEEMARLMARIHQKLVVNNDPSVANFVRTPEGHLACVDFGRSRTFRWQSWYFLFYVGKELSRLRRTGFHQDGELWKAFYRQYHAAQDWGPLGHRIVMASFAYWNWRGRRHHPTGRPVEHAS